MSYLSRLLKLWSLLLFAGFCAYFGAFNSNAGNIALSFPPWITQITLPSWLAFLSAFMFGAAVASLVFGVEHVRKTLHVRRLSKQLETYAPPASAKQAGRAPGAGPTLDRAEPLAGPSAGEPAGPRL